MIKITAQTRYAMGRIKGLRTALEDRLRIDQLVQQVALKTQVALVKATPKGWTGQTRRGWVTEKIPNGYRVTNPYKVMLFLEEGTQAHGPREKKFLYIPLRPGAMIWHAGLKRGKDYILVKRVKGIKALKIVAKEKPIAEKRTYDAFVKYIRQALATPVSAEPTTKS